MGVDDRRENLPHHHRQPVAVIFTYGTLKKGFSNHGLLQDLMQTGDAVFRCNCRTVDAVPLVCGPFRVPFLLNLPGADGADRVSGEMYAVTARGLARLDELEGTVTGHYERLPIVVEPEDCEEEIECGVQAYFADRSYAVDMWETCGRIGYSVYGEKESKGYVKRKDRPVNLSFLEQIRIFIASSKSLQ
ncbi:Putative gamma-glutamylcyclotransferase At3g02910 [Linum perenne]